MQKHALTQGLAPEESAEHARLLNEYVQALEGHKQVMRAAWNHDNGGPSDDAIERAWLADARIESTRRHLETFRSEHGIP
jgi:hypothetical protein